jgi:hypothetical protein
MDCKHIIQCLCFHFLMISGLFKYVADLIKDNNNMSIESHCSILSVHFIGVAWSTREMEFLFFMSLMMF